MLNSFKNESSVSNILWKYFGIARGKLALCGLGGQTEQTERNSKKTIGAPKRQQIFDRERTMVGQRQSSNRKKPKYIRRS